MMRRHRSAPGGEGAAMGLVKRARVAVIELLS